jgi:hypothetical protein
MRRMRRLGFHVYKTHPTSFYDVLFINRRVVSRARYLAVVWLPRAYRALKRRLTPGRASAAPAAPARGVPS